MTARRCRSAPLRRRQCPRPREGLDAPLAARGFIVACGGLGGVMDAVARGVASGSGTSLGFLPGGDLNDDDTVPPSKRISRALTIAIPTGLGEIRNTLLALCCQGMVAIGGGYGMLTEISFALRLGKPVVRLDSWEFSHPSVPADDDLVQTATDSRDRRRDEERPERQHCPLGCLSAAGDQANGAPSR
jgi:uncharacterized protein (TIGR00725 family)